MSKKPEHTAIVEAFDLMIDALMVPHSPNQTEARDRIWTDPELGDLVLVRNAGSQAEPGDRIGWLVGIAMSPRGEKPPEAEGPRMFNGGRPRVWSVKTLAGRTVKWANVEVLVLRRGGA